jgi:hypothetical protein
VLIKNYLCKYSIQKQANGHHFKVYKDLDMAAGYNKNIFSFMEDSNYQHQMYQLILYSKYHSANYLNSHPHST